MLPEQDRELLTAYVDGELGTRQRKSVLRLLRRSAEARELLRQLQQDARELRDLPQPRLAPDFSDRVLQTICQNGLRPTRRPDRATVSFWTVAAAAAAILCVVSLGTYALVVATLADDTSPSQVARGPKSDRTSPPGIAKDTPPPPDKEDIARGRPGEGASKKQDGEKKGTTQEPLVKNPDKSSDPAALEKPSNNPPGPLSTGPLVEGIRPDEVTVWVPSLFKLRELPLEAERKRLQQDLARDKAFYLDLLCREGTHAFPRVQAALKTAGIDLLVDPIALACLKNPKLRTSYFVYFEDIMPAELGALLEQLGGPEDINFDPKKPTLGQFAGSDYNVVLFRMTAEHRKLLLRYLGVDLRQTGDKPTGPLGVDLSRPLAEQTADQVVGTLSTGVPRPSAGVSASKAPPRLGLALALGQMPRPQSVEVKRFLESRKPPRKGSLQVILVLRGKP